MIILYNIVLIVLTIIFIPFILLAFIIQPKFRAGFFEKIGFYSFQTNNKDNTTIFHAVSVGETNAIKDLVTEYRKKHPEEIIVITTTTKTGQEIAQKVFKNIADKITYFPYDFFFSVLSFFNTFNLYCAPDKLHPRHSAIFFAVIPGSFRISSTTRSRSSCFCLN